MKRYIKCATSPVKLKVEYYEYNRYGGDDVLRVATVSGSNLLEALSKMADNMSLYIDSSDIESQGYTAEEVLDEISSSNGDGCDFIVKLTNLSNGEVLIEEDYEPESYEEDWDNI